MKMTHESWPDVCRSVKVKNCCDVIEEKNIVLIKKQAN